MSNVDPTTSAPLRPAAVVIGSGAWGTTFVSLLAQTGTPTAIRARRREAAEEINSDTNGRCVPGHRLPQGLKAITDLARAVAGTNTVVVTVSSQEAQRVLEPLRDALTDDAVAVSLMKGIELSTGLRMSRAPAEILGVDSPRVVAVPGPNLTDEIAAGQPTTTVTAAGSERVVAQIASLYATGTFHPYTDTDVLGVELYGAVENAIALAVGTAVGRGLGDSSEATIITRGLVETTRLGLRLRARPETFPGLADIGDLMATCSPPLNRNQAFSRHPDEGVNMAETTVVSRGTAEGAKSARAALDLARTHGMDMPITAGVVTVVEGAASVAQVTDVLSARPRKSEGMRAAPLQT